jgi:hypothetical protein
MKLLLVFILVFWVGDHPAKAKTLIQKFDKAAFYDAMASGDLTAIDKELDVVKGKDGYEGALLMRKAGLVKKPKEKLALFKAGRIKLETALLADNENTEFHFLRLAIEEHAPKIVKYRKDIEKDKDLVIKNFKNLSPAVQHAILDYCKNSKVLHKEEF